MEEKGGGGQRRIDVAEAGRGRGRGVTEDESLMNKGNVRTRS